ncbi:MAG: translation initiation factor IF-2 [Patescibacteria group bacterium]|nr:translation initiation factor IF-2 [Patescibacteria group bacterium]
MTTKESKNLIEKAPVVVVLGHVDHGKSSLLEAIKDFRITHKESGGITQHIGAYEVEHKSKKITFIDTPGHEAFCAMRSRGAEVADIALLVIAAEEGIKPQTQEAIDCIKDAGLQMVVVLNKVDKPEANPQKVKNELLKADIVVEGLGGEIPCVETSAIQKTGIDELLELILLVSEMQELKADPDQHAEGVVIETHLDERMGFVAILLIKNGTLKIQDIIATQGATGKVKNMKDYKGNSIKTANPSQPVAVLGLETRPFVGEIFKSFTEIEKAKEYAIKKDQANTNTPSIAKEGQKTLNIILRADVVGTLEALEGMIESLPKEDLLIRVLKSDVGPIVEDDVNLAVASKAKIFGFRVKPNPLALRLADQKSAKIYYYEVIYELIQEIRRLMKREIESEIVRRDIGQMQVLKVFRTEKGRQIIGGRIVDGEVLKVAKMEILREDELLSKGRILELQREKKAIERAEVNDEVGILYEGKEKIQEDDILNFYIEEKKKSEL